MKKVAVIGLGYVGFPLACAIAKTQQYEVVGYDLSAVKVAAIAERQSPVEDAQAQIDIKSVNLTASTDPSILAGSDIFIIAVPTPIDSEYHPDLSPVIGATTTISQYLRSGNLVVIESTINPGVCEEIVLPILEKNTGLVGGQDFELSHCPERINPGDSKWNVYNIPRNIGSLTLAGNKMAADFYRSFLQAEVNEMANLKEAEATKIIENTFRDINIAYVNELAQSFDHLGIDLNNVIQGASNKPFAFMKHLPGCGVGGHCIAVDPYYLIERAKKAGFDHKFLRNARMVNNSMPRYLVDKFIKTMNKAGLALKTSRIGLLGLSYKANISDLRESPALEIKKILEEEYEVKLEIYDPFNPGLSTKSNLVEMIAACDGLVLATNHQEFVMAPTSAWQGIKVIADGRNCLNKTELLKSGILYTGIGR
jgi:nucleotide sugar dehydrogenase